MTGTGAEFNGIPLACLQRTITEVTDRPELAQHRFTVINTWIEGTASRSTMHEWDGGGRKRLHAQTFTATADDPTLGHGHGPSPYEFMLHAVTACLVDGIVTAAARRGVRLHSVESVARATVDISSSLGVDRPSVDQEARSGFQSIEINVDLRGDANDETLDALVRSSYQRSPMVALVANGTPVTATRVC